MTLAETLKNEVTEYTTKKLDKDFEDAMEEISSRCHSLAKLGRDCFHVFIRAAPRSYDSSDSIGVAPENHARIVGWLESEGFKFPISTEPNHIIISWE